MNTQSADQLTATEAREWAKRILIECSGTAVKTQTPYAPKPVRGQSVKGYTKVNLAQVKRLFADGQSFDGFIVGNKVAAFHFFGGWHLACRLQRSTWAEFESTLNEYHSYLDAELGNRAAIYLKNR